MEGGICMPIFENASEAVCGRDASRTEKCQKICLRAE